MFARKKKKTSKKWEKEKYYAPIYHESKETRFPFKEILWGLVSVLIILAVLERDDLFLWLRGGGKEATEEGGQAVGPGRHSQKNISLFDDSKDLPSESGRSLPRVDRREEGSRLKGVVCEQAGSAETGVERLEGLLACLWERLRGRKNICDSEKFLEEMLPNVAYSARDVEAFVDERAKVFHRRRRFEEIFGFFTSALINHLSESSNVTLSPKYPLDYLGYKNGVKAPHEILVNGNLGYNIACRMRDGRFRLKGNAQVAANEMRGGRVEIDGNVKSLSEAMEGGTVILHGNAEVVAFKLEGGKVEVFGDVYSDVASHMMDGEVVIHGSPRTAAYMLSGGLVVVEKDVLQDTGTKMKNGTVCILGNSGLGFKKYYVSTLQEGGRIDIYGCAPGVGARSKGGEIHVEGCVPEILDACRAKVYHQGKLLNPERRPKGRQALPVWHEP